MLRWAIIFAIISVIAGLFGFSDIAHGAGSIARVLFAICLCVFLIFAAMAIAVGYHIKR